MSDDDYKRGYREGFKDGFSTAKESPESVKVKPYVWPWPTTKPTTVKASGCSVCGVEFNGTHGYACPRLDCPSKVVLL